MTLSTDLKPLHALLPPAYPEGLQEIAEWLYVALMAEEPPLGLEPAALAAVVLRQADQLSEALGGSSIYVHRGVSFKNHPRNLAICAEFRGDYKVLARKHKLSEQQIRNIVDAWQRQQFLAKQGDMFRAPAAAPSVRASTDHTTGGTIGQP